MENLPKSPVSEEDIALKIAMLFRSMGKEFKARQALTGEPLNDSRDHDNDSDMAAHLPNRPAA